MRGLTQAKTAGTRGQPRSGVRRIVVLGWFAALCASLSGGGFSIAKGSDSSRILDALKILGRVPPGKALLSRAETAWGLQGPEQLLHRFEWGPVSRTDAVLTRHFDPKTGEERRERRITVYLRQDQPLEDLVLDIAHELTHATAGPSWDPYDPELTATRYIQAALDGSGGEIEALYHECRVAAQLSLAYGVSAARCSRYLVSGRSGEAAIDRQKIRGDFYQVGKWYPELRKSLGSAARSFPLLSSKSPRLFSSTGHSPYPVALLREFRQITEIACENSRRRLASAEETGHDPAGRSPASETAAETQLASAARFLARRCR